MRKGWSKRRRIYCSLGCNLKDSGPSYLIVGLILIFISLIPAIFVLLVDILSDLKVFSALTVQIDMINSVITLLVKLILELNLQIEFIILIFTLLIIPISLLSIFGIFFFIIGIIGISWQFIDSKRKLQPKTNISNYQRRDIKKIPNNHRNSSLKLLITIIITSYLPFFIYFVSDWIFFAVPTRDITSLLLTSLGVKNSHIPTVDPFSTIPETLKGIFPFIEATNQTPGINIPLIGADFWLVKKLLLIDLIGLFISLIVISDTSNANRIRAGITIFFITFIVNILRLTLVLWTISFLVFEAQIDPEEAFFWVHDFATKVFIIIVSIFYIFLIEIMGIPITERLADWISLFKLDIRIIR